MLLSDYRATLRRYLHDASDTLFPLADKDAYINEGLARGMGVYQAQLDELT